MTQKFGKWPKYLGNGLDTWDTSEVFEKRLTMLEMAYEFDKRLKYVGNDAYMGKGLSILETTNIFGK